MSLESWASKWNLSPQAWRELQAELLAPAAHTETTTVSGSEAAAQQQVRLYAPQVGAVLWRNNVGATLDSKSGMMIRYGLCNDSKRINDHVKSSDLIGSTTLEITPAMVGRQVAVFTAVESKKPGWKYTGTEREKAQLAYANIVLSRGGIATFATCVADFQRAITGYLQ